ncbi:flagellar basal body-associated protein FliL [Georgenia sp. SYP-B2076]|uniref:flagellar basal body-associated FliL family protein n=1 Tax=Georgenia sp. SYP-B2076 TaxID=2495881 RepID=UPI000F8DA9F7|nr:flagellar basal body-associated FliL family protein [Georgenia sp. SYP-B2076]
MAELQRTVGRPVSVTGTPAPEGSTRKTVDKDADAPPRRRKKWLLAVVAVVVLAAVAFVLLRPPAGEAATPAAPEPGIVVPIDPISVNLTDGHYLRFGFTMQMTKEATAEVQTAKALDIAIEVFSGRDPAELNDPARRAELKNELLRQLSEAFEGQVMDVYLTDFVTQ